MKTIHAALLPLLFAASIAAAAWTPPPKPNPRAIHNEARKDRMESRFDDALAKHVWLHREGTKADPAYAGVRLSFALGDWANLAAKHPPALVALDLARDTAEADVRSGQNPVPAFQDFAAINREMDEPGRTVALFMWIEARDAKLAREVARFAEHALIEAGDLKTAGRYLDANAAMGGVVRMHMAMSRTAPQAGDPDAAKRAAAVFGREAGRIIAVLVANGRAAHAKVISQQALEVNGAPEVKEIIDAALKGTVPRESLTREDKAQLRQLMP